MEGNIGAQIVIFIAYATAIVLAIGLGMRIMRKTTRAYSGLDENDSKGES